MTNRNRHYQQKSIKKQAPDSPLNHLVSLLKVFQETKPVYLFHIDFRFLISRFLVISEARVMFLLNRGRRLAFDLLKYMSIFCLNILLLSKLIGLKIALIWLILNRNGHSSLGFFPSDFTHRNFAARIPWSRFDRQN